MNNARFGLKLKVTMQTSQATLGYSLNVRTPCSAHGRQTKLVHLMKSW